MKRLAIVADHPLVVQSIRLALRQTAGFDLVGSLDGRLDTCEQLAALAPDVVLVDDMRDPQAALGRLADVARTRPTAKAVLLTTQMDAAWLHDAFDAGAAAVISKVVHPVALGTLLRETARGTVVHRYQPPAAEDREPCPLTERELEILRLVAEGHTNGAIARRLWVTQQTVKFHLSNTYRKLGVANRTQATRYAYAHDLVAPDELLAS